MKKKKKKKKNNNKKKIKKQKVIQKQELKKMKIRKITNNILSILGILITLLLFVNLIKLQIIPKKILALFILLEIIINTITILLLKKNKKILHIIGILLLFILIMSNLCINSIVVSTNQFINKSFTNYITNKIDYIVLTNINNPVNNIDEVNENETFYYYKYSKKIEEALKELGNYHYIETDSVSKTLDELNHSNNYLVISKGNYEYLLDSSILLNKDNYKIIKEYTITYKEKRNDEVKTSFTIYLNGVDFTGIMRDFNMLITVNMEKKKVLLTPILRGYYINVPAYNMKDTLMCLGSLDSDVSKEALEELFQTKIDYTVNINTNSLVDVVDNLNGIEFCSDYSFQTTHALVTDTYDDRGKTKLYVEKGCKNYSGIEILAIARERLNLRNNERGRIDNCKKIMMSIGKKSLSLGTLINYQQVLDSYSNLYTTDMNKEVMIKIINSIIKDYANYQIEEQFVDGTDGTAPGHLGTVEVGVTFPDMDQVNQASKKIKEVLK